MQCKCSYRYITTNITKITISNKLSCEKKISHYFMLSQSHNHSVCNNKSYMYMYMYINTVHQQGDMIIMLLFPSYKA